jgi:hypothetical protein
MSVISQIATQLRKHLEYCLNARAAFEKSILLGECDQGFDENVESWQNAEAAGRQAFLLDVDRTDVPALFRSSRALTLWWQDGWDYALNGVMIEGCDSCNDGTGNPCPCHG